MTRSDSIINLAKALCAMQAELKPAPKDSSNPFLKSKYADLATVWETCRGPLTKNGLSVAQFASAEDKEVTITTMLLHTSGEFLSSDLTVQAKESTPQGIGSAITYARRYGLSALIGLCSEEDDDGAEVSGTKTVTMPEPFLVPIKKIRDELVKAQKAFEKVGGNESFMSYLGSHGFESIEQVSDVTAGQALIKDLSEAYKAIKGEK